MKKKQPHTYSKTIDYSTTSKKTAPDIVPCLTHIKTNSWGECQTATTALLNA